MQDIAAKRADASVIGIQKRGVVVTPLEKAMAEIDWVEWRPIAQAWLDWRTLADTLAQPGPNSDALRPQDDRQPSPSEK
jgi:hypothetical protein